MRLKQTNSQLTDASEDGPEATLYVLGGAQVGASIVRRLQAGSRPVRYVDETCDTETAPCVRGDPSDVGVLKEAGVSEASTVVVATARDRRNLLIAQLVRSHLGVSDVLVLVNDPDRADVVAAAGHVPTCATAAVSDAVVDDLETMELRLDQRA